MAPRRGPTSNADEVLHGEDLPGRRVLVTGVSAGVRVETVRVLAAHGAQLVGTDPVGEGGLRLVDLDLASLASVRARADALLAAGERFDAVIANVRNQDRPPIGTFTYDGTERRSDVEREKSGKEHQTADNVVDGVVLARTPEPRNSRAQAPRASWMGRGDGSSRR